MAELEVDGVNGLGNICLECYAWSFFSLFASRGFYFLFLFDYDTLTNDGPIVKVNDFLASDFYNQCNLTQLPQMDKDAKQVYRGYLENFHAAVYMVM